MQIKNHKSQKRNKDLRSNLANNYTGLQLVAEISLGGDSKA